MRFLKASRAKNLLKCYHYILPVASVSLVLCSSLAAMSQLICVGSDIL
jgi:hypothetical protein